MTIATALSSSFGILLIGVLVTTLLHGFTTFQSIAYFRAFSSDAWSLKSMIGVLMIIECVHLAFCWHFLWFYFTSAISNPGLLLRTIWSCDLTIPLSMFSGLLCHAFFIIKLWKMSAGYKWIVCAPIAVMELASIGSLLALTIKLFRLPFWPEFAAQEKTLVTVAVVLIVCTDITIAGGLCYFLRKSRTGFQQTDNILSRLFYYTIKNGILTSVLDIVMMVLFLTIPNSLAYLAVFEALSKVYVASVLTSLNTRSELRKQQHNGDAEIFRAHKHKPSTSSFASIIPPFSLKVPRVVPWTYKPESSSSLEEQQQKEREAEQTIDESRIIRIGPFAGETHPKGMGSEGGSTESV
ncbi:hypothetical protein SISSUDRAFT_1127777 [Sistotremastrum suecicum HHB10207 ss-3]|uniref:DUF6534 domain-containing protein n=1 Tax=Sistotremastrum suecicum HHB10207 ss-3 TaxID=1314776 RepID=A0A166EPP9_9AGAM|nr:hypothetical protein SISSUDRAFT_1127777 [Sistotremastrum suecicum HHB10207 ss-3]